jgi:multiple sugar transport system permease protein
MAEPAAGTLAGPAHRVEGGARPEPLRYAVWSVVAIVIAMIFLFPLYWAFSTSLRNPIDTFTVTGLGVPWVNFEPTWDNWADQLATAESRRALANSTMIAIGASLLALLLGTPAAYALARFRFARIPNRDITVWFLSQRVLPPVATVIPFYLVMRALGLLDTHTALILINATFVLPFVVVIVRQTFLDLPVELEEAALIDGAGSTGATNWPCPRPRRHSPTRA